MARRFNPPPDWPTPPEGWQPPADWQPDPAWGPAPEGWQLYVDDDRAAADEGPVVARQQAVAERPARPGGRRGLIAAAVGAGLLGLLIGCSAAGGDDDEVAAVTADRDQLQSSVEQLQRNLEGANTARDAAEDRVTEVEAGLAEAQTLLDEAEQQLTDRETAVAEREAAVTATEEAVEASTIPGDGVFVVGDDVAAGSYRTEGGSFGCYYAFLDGLGADADIISNELSDGPLRVELKDGDIWQTRGCSDWTPA